MPSIHLRCLCLLLCHTGLTLYAQTPDIQKQGSDVQTHSTDGEIKLSESFLRELDAAFQITPQAAPITPPKELTTDQLHEWVGTPDSIPNDTSRFTREYFACKAYLKEFCHPVPPDSAITIPGLAFMINNCGPQRKAVTFDANRLASYLVPSARRRRKLRAQAARARAAMDLAFPIRNTW